MKHSPRRAQRLATKVVATVAMAAAATLALAGCGSSETGSSDAKDQTISYWLWDTNQQPAYQQCADVGLTGMTDTNSANNRSCVPVVIRQRPR